MGVAGAVGGVGVGVGAWSTPDAVSRSSSSGPAKRPASPEHTSGCEDGDVGTMGPEGFRTHCGEAAGPGWPGWPGVTGARPARPPTDCGAGIGVLSQAEHTQEGTHTYRHQIHPKQCKSSSR